MKINNVWAAYFSPTKTTEKVALTLAQNLAASGRNIKTFDFTLPAAREGFPHVGEGDLVVFGVPTYAGRVPNVLLPYLSSLRGEGALAVCVVTFGNRAFDNSLIELRDVLEADGFRTIAACAIACEHSFSYTLGAGRPDAEDLAELSNFAAACAVKLKDASAARTASCAAATPDGNAVACAPVFVDGRPDHGDYYSPRDRSGVGIDIRKVKPKVSASCNGCGLCASLCPMGSLNPAALRERRTMEFTGICIKCGACFKGCPQHAVYFDDPGYLYHKKELEAAYALRAKNSFYL